MKRHKIEEVKLEIIPKKDYKLSFLRDPGVNFYTLHKKQAVSFCSK